MSELRFLDDQIEQRDWLEFRSDSVFEIPPFACMRITGSIFVGNRIILTVDRPDKFGSQFGHLINGPAKVIQQGDYGVGTFGPMFAAYEINDGLPLVDDPFGPIEGSWKLSRYSQGWRALKEDPGGDERVFVIQQPMVHLRAQLTTTLSNSATAMANPTYWDGAAWQTTTFDVTVREAMGLTANINSGSIVFCEWEASLDNLIVTGAACA